MMKNLPERHTWRFFVTQAFSVGAEIELTDGEAHFAGVLRIRAGEQVELTDGVGNVALAEVVVNERHRVRVRVLECFSFARKLPLIELFIGVSKPAALEESVESAVQLGADRITFVETSKTQKFRSGSANGNERIQKIARESCRLSKRPWFCEVNPQIINIDHVVESNMAAIFVCDEAPLHDLYHSPPASPATALHASLFNELTKLVLAHRNGQALGRVAILVGPESGFANQEKSDLQARAASVHVPLVFVSLGDQILTVPNAVRAAVTLAGSFLRNHQHI